MSVPKKWIQAKIQSLDPHKDYIEIWRLSSSYGLNDFMQNFIYALTFPNFVVTDWGSRVIWREDGGKVVSRSTSRVEQTGSANALWWFYGPEDSRTIKSVEGINNLHAHWAKKYPGAFSYNDDYVYVCAFTALTMHRLKLKMGVPGFTENEKIAAHLFWRDMCKLFRAENDQPITGYPDSFDGLVEFCETFENASKPKVERGNLIITAIHEQFVFRFFPKELHWFGHQLLRAMSLTTTLDTLQVDRPDPVAAELLPQLAGYILGQMEMNADDPTESYIEARMNMSGEEKADVRMSIQALDKEFPKHYVEMYKSDPKFVGCPFHTALGEGVTPQSATDKQSIRSIEAQVAALGGDE